MKSIKRSIHRTAIALHGARVHSPGKHQGRPETRDRRSPRKVGVVNLHATLLFWIFHQPTPASTPVFQWGDQHGF